ncbi:hypothetical protein XU18_0462 [Perkinsela sp. CCAP 1560/4]|nr:hypothetical protein XU18_0462 [Perkinsela sp. CCAP 1560/4]|eukprot:KNH09777.1 hypothetical protein XU18_0462 [Perkinsela sp. CCAP 1560/4]
MIYVTYESRMSELSRKHTSFEGTSKRISDAEDQSLPCVPAFLSLKFLIRKILRHRDTAYRHTQLAIFFENHLRCLMTYLKRKLENVHQPQNPLIIDSLRLQQFVLESYNLLQQYVQINVLLIAEEACAGTIIAHSSSKLRYEFIGSYIPLVHNYLLLQNNSDCGFTEKFIEPLILGCIESVPDMKTTSLNNNTCLIYCLNMFTMPELSEVFRKMLKEGIRSSQFHICGNTNSEEIQTQSAYATRDRNTIHSRYPQFAEFIKKFVPLHIILKTDCHLLYQWTGQCLCFHMSSFLHASKNDSRAGQVYLTEHHNDIFSLVKLLHVVFRIQMLTHTCNIERLLAEELLTNQDTLTFHSTVNETLIIRTLEALAASSTVCKAFLRQEVIHSSMRTRDLVSCMRTFTEVLVDKEARLTLTCLIWTTFVLRTTDLPNGEVFQKCHQQALATSLCNDVCPNMIDPFFLPLQRRREHDSLWDIMQALPSHMQKEISHYVLSRHDGKKEILQMTLFSEEESLRERDFMSFLLYCLSSGPGNQQWLEYIHNLLGETLVRKFFEVQENIFDTRHCIVYKKELDYRFECLLAAMTRARNVLDRTSPRNRQRTKSLYQRAGQTSCLEASISLSAKQEEIDLAFQQDSISESSLFPIRKCLIMLNDFERALMAKDRIEKCICFPISHCYWPASFSYSHDDSGSLLSSRLLTLAEWHERYPTFNLQTQGYPNCEFFVSLDRTSFFITVQKTSGEVVRLKVSHLQLLVLQEMQRSPKNYYYHHRMAEILEVSQECLYHSLQPLLADGTLRCDPRSQESNASLTEDLCYFIA